MTYGQLMEFKDVAFLSLCLTLLVLISIGLLLTKLTGGPFTPVKQAPMEYDAGALTTTENLKFSDFNYEVLMTIGDNKIVIGDPPIATIDMKTGDVELHGKPNDAALKFWEAVEEMKP